MAVLVRFTPLILALQGYCMYHVHTNKKGSTWYFIILFFPLIGSIFYLYNQFYADEKLWDTAKNIKEGIKEMVDKDHRVDELLKKEKYSDTITNKTKLAEEFFHRKQYHQAIDLFSSCLEGFNKEDPEIISKLMKSYYQLKQYDKVIEYGDLIQDSIEFKKGDERVLYAWSQYHQGDVDLAQSVFKTYDQQFANYPHRLEYAKFLKASGKMMERQNLLNRMKEEIDHMDPKERKMKSDIVRELKKMSINQ